MEIDILDPYLYAGDPYPTYAWLRENAPLYWDEKNRIYVVSRYDDVVHVSRHPELFCNGQGVMPDSDQQISIITMDEPRHAQLRSLISRGFQPRMVKALEERVREFVTEILDNVADRGECDFVRDIAVPLPLLVIAEMIGIRREDYDRFYQWTDAMILAAGQRANEEILSRATAAYLEYAEYLKDVFEDRRKNPREDLVSVLVAANDTGKLVGDENNITTDELVMFMTMLLVAGNETTRNATSGGMLALIEHPQERARLMANPELLPTAIEEILRWVAPVIGFRRTVIRETELHGVKLEPGDKIWMLYQSANRDERQFPDAGTFKIDRHPNYHVAFGVGNHFCLGANLARFELRIMFEQLLRRLPDIQLAPGTKPRRAPSPLIRNVASMPVVFTPERSAARVA